MVSFKDLYFGMPDAAFEAANHRHEFLSTFVDHGDAVSAVRNKQKFLLLGPKGTGKSAVAKYLELTGEVTGIVAQTRDISDLPLAEISNLKTGESGGVGRTVTAWRLLILCALLDVVLRDESSSINRDPEVVRVVRVLRGHGFLDPTPSRAVLHASQTTLKLQLPTGVVAAERQSSQSVHLYHVVPYLEQWVATNESDNTHLLCLDGLDSIYLNDERYVGTLSALIHAVYVTNRRLRDSNATSHVVVLLRNDVFTRMAIPDVAKMRPQLSVDLDWRMLSGNPKHSALFRLVNEKATALIGGAADDVVARFIPPVEVGTRGGMPGATKDPHRYLLDLTRHTPRDLLQLLDRIREVVTEFGDAGTDAGGRVSQRALREGVLRYATKYFVDAVSDELVGRGTEANDARRALHALRDLGSRHFTAAAYSIELFGSDRGVERERADEMLKWLFYAGAVGNVKRGASESYLQFFHRRDDSDIYLRGPLVVHNALVYAWALPWH